MLHIAIIGCGQAGSRHIQSLALLKEPACIYLYDRSEDAIRVSIERFGQALQGHDENLFTIRGVAMDEIPAEIDISIFASTSEHRAGLIKSHLEHTTPRHVILEKFLFQKLSDYSEIGDVLASRNVQAWVNQWFSSDDAFRRIADWLQPKGPVSMRITGTQWGLGCNSVHFVELFDHLNKRGGLALASSVLDDGVIDGSRPGYSELTGTIYVSSSNGATLEIGAERTEFDGLIHFAFSCGGREAVATLDSYDLDVEFRENGTVSTEKFVLPYQSLMTAGLVESLMQTGQCDLPEYRRSAYQHVLLVQCFNQHIFGPDGWQTAACPVT